MDIKLDTENKVIGGVCAGLANHFEMDAKLMRIIFVLGFFVTGLTPLLYIILWILMKK